MTGMTLSGSVWSWLTSESIYRHNNSLWWKFKHFYWYMGRKLLKPGQELLMMCGLMVKKSHAERTFSPIWTWFRENTWCFQCFSVLIKSSYRSIYVWDTLIHRLSAAKSQIWSLFYDFKITWGWCGLRFHNNPLNTHLLTPENAPIFIYISQSWMSNTIVNSFLFWKVFCDPPSGFWDLCLGNHRAELHT